MENYYVTFTKEDESGKLLKYKELSLMPKIEGNYLNTGYHILFSLNQFYNETKDFLISAHNVSMNKTAEYAAIGYTLIGYLSRDHKYTFTKFPDSFYQNVGNVIYNELSLDSLNDSYFG